MHKGSSGLSKLILTQCRTGLVSSRGFTLSCVIHVGFF